jgi:ABC-type sugar transport system ATPase subunit
LNNSKSKKLEMVAVSKRYPGTLAVDSVDFDLIEGEVHALMGENGAGKSSLMKMMAGEFNDYEGKILINQTEIDLHSPADAKKAGIEMIHQELSLALPLSIAENILAGNLPVKGFFVDRAKMIELAHQNLEKVGLNVNPLLTIEKLSQHEQQLVEIAKALSNNPSILIMDEPTSALSRSEVLRLFSLIKQLKNDGLSIVYISHHIPEIFEIADRATVMRDGKKVDCKMITDLTPEALVDMMVGESMSHTKITRKINPGDVRFKFENISRYGFFHNVSFKIKRGEILGIGGLAGSGRTEIARSIMALDPLDDGRIFKDDEEVFFDSMSEAIANGFAYLSEDRKTEGLALELSSQYNAISANQFQKNISKKEKIELYQKLATDTQVYPYDPNRFVYQYSGGNQQKILLCKWLATQPELLILDEPTRGVDIGAKQVIHDVIAEIADMGKSVLLISSDLPELVELSDRVIILRKGKIIQEMKDNFNEESILLEANG